MKPFVAAIALLILVAVVVGAGFAYVTWRARLRQPTSDIDASLTADELFRRSRAQAVAPGQVVGSPESPVRFTRRQDGGWDASDTAK